MQRQPPRSTCTDTCFPYQTPFRSSPERTATSFWPDPFSGRANARMYRTGDHGRWRADGAILFAGRFDDQVKVRGFRIELNEIAAALSRHPALRAVHVAAPQDPNGGPQDEIGRA